LEVSVDGGLQERGPATGMVMDFSDLASQISRLVIEPLDHTHLNELFDFVPTAEALAVWAFEALRESGLPVTRIRLWETPTSFAEVIA
jgi:6-pyruvoyltetrahydropterin/6-carboxytetrahydropterin synthase